jgi:outer membrane protein assembly factor BamD (BamD/ComL family)
MNKKIYLFLVFFILALPFGGSALAQEEGGLYSSAIQEARAGNLEFSFIQLHTLVRTYPQSKYLENSLFAIGEYHFQENNLADAANAFSQLLEKFPDSKSTVFAMAYLLKIAQRREAAELVASLEKAIATFHKLSLVFRNSKAFTYRSAFLNKYKADYYIDKVEFYKDGELFAQVSY